MRSTPAECESSLVCIPRKTARRWACFAECSISSQKWAPGTLVRMDRNGPPNGVPGLGSQDSSWLIPPSSWMKMTWRAFFFISAAKAGRTPGPSPGGPKAPPLTAAANAPVRPALSTDRRLRAWSAEWQE